MGKNHNRWEPRRRGFDDDRSSHDSPEAQFFQRQTIATSPPVGAEVKWFSPGKGFGFVKLADGSEAFLHISALEGAGLSELADGTPLKVRVEQGRKGKQVSEVVEVGEGGRPTAHEPGRRTPDSGPDGREEIEGVGTVKWYEAAKGFGFVSVEGLSKDVFVHVSALNRSGLTGLHEGQKVVVKYSQGHKGPEARSISASEN
jgi:cold shock protein